MKAWIFIGILVAILSGGMYYYYTTTQTRIETLVADNSTLRSNLYTATEANKTTIETLDEIIRLEQQARDNFAQAEQDLREIQEQNNQLRERLGRHDLSALAAARPNLVQRTINNATENALRCFEILSGAALTERERNATSAREFNSECPFLWPGSTTSR